MLHNPTQDMKRSTGAPVSVDETLCPQSEVTDFVFYLHLLQFDDGID